MKDKCKAVCDNTAICVFRSQEINGINYDKICDTQPESMAEICNFSHAHYTGYFAT